MDYEIKLPDFLIIGAQKAGTTSLYFYCKQHPNIFMSRPKEPMFFNSKRQPKITREESGLGRSYNFFTLAEYSSLFKNAGRNQIIGEASTAYLANPAAALWMKKIIPDVRIIVVLRDPLKRAYSAYKMYVQRGLENRSFEEAVLSEIEYGTKGIRQGQMYLTLGLYASQLKPYLNYFPKEHIFIGDYDEYNQDNVKFLQVIFNFLGVRNFIPKDLKRLLVSDPVSDVATPMQYDLSDLIKAKVKSFFESDINALQKEVDFDVEKWIR